jgi:hypothetical protein
MLVLAASTSPLWKDVFATVNDTVRSAAVITAGIFAYIKFVRGRVHHASMTASVRAKIVEIDGVRSLHITANFSNNGTFRMIFPLGCKQEVSVHCASQAMWSTACAQGREVQWTKGPQPRIVELLKVDGVLDADQYLEPGDSFTRERLIPLPQGDWRAYRVSFVVKPRCKKLIGSVPSSGWETTTVVVPKEAENNGSKGSRIRSSRNDMGMPNAT